MRKNFGSWERWFGRKVRLISSKLGKEISNFQTILLLLTFEKIGEVFFESRPVVVFGH
jgi:hypothetical protein